MTFRMGIGVKRYSHRGPSRKYIGLTTKSPSWVMGRWAFNNPVSATIFEHINSKGDLEYAEATIKRFEEIIAAPAMKNYSEKSIFDLAESVPHPAAQAIGRIGNGIKAVAGDLGSFIDDNTVKVCGGVNRYTAKDRDNYVNYALAYWAINPQAGPAYRYASTIDARGPHARHQKF